MNGEKFRSDSATYRRAQWDSALGANPVHGAPVAGAGAVPAQGQEGANQAGGYNSPGGLASNPANGIANIPLNGEATGESNAGGVTPDELANVLRKVTDLGPNASESEPLKNTLIDIKDRVVDETIKQRIQRIINALEMNNDSNKPSKDPLTGEPLPTALDMAKELAGDVRKMEVNQNQNESVKSAGLEPYNWRVAQQKKKKGRGNPFRVLMGQVGKLLDHGVAKRDIVRYLMQKGYWNEETIAKAVNIVRDYNRKKTQGKPTSADPTEPDAKEKAENEKDNEDSKKSDSHKVQEDAFVTSPEFPKGKRIHLKPTPPPMTMASNDAPYNFIRSAAREKDKEAVYTLTPTWEKRSTAELIARASWLKSLNSWTKDGQHSEGREAADKTGASAELKAIRNALSKRGFDDGEIDSLI